MELRQVIEELSRQVELAKDRGLKDVSIESLEVYMIVLRERIEKHTPLTTANIELQRQANEHDFQQNHAMFRSVIDSGQAALKANILVGGGAAAALLAFASSAWKALNPAGVELLGLTIFLLACGVVLAVIAGGVTYLSQGLYYDGMDKPDSCWETRLGNALRYTSLTLTATSYGLYGWACWNIYRVMGSFSIDSFIRVG